MPEFELVQSTFSGGEMTPRVHGRLDIDKYFSGAAEILNFIVQRHGGAMKRPGTRFVIATKNGATEQARLLPFNYSTTQAYGIEVGNIYARFHTSEATVLSTTVTAAITNGAFPAGITDWDDNSAGTGAIAHDATNLRLTLNSGGSGATNQAAAEQDVAITETTTDHYIAFEIVSPLPNLDVIFQVGSATTLSDVYAPVRFSPGFHIVKVAPASNATLYFQFINDQDTEFDMQIDNISILTNQPIEIQTPYIEADLSSLKFTQSADVLFIASPIWRPYELQRFANDEWSLVEHDVVNGPWLAVNTDATTQMKVSANTGNAINVTATNTSLINGGSGFLSTDIGRLVGLQVSAAWGWGIITAITSTTVAVVAVLNAFDGTPTTNTTTWMLGSWSDTTGWPEVNAFHSGRLTWGNSVDQPNNLWFSRSNNFNDHRPFDDDDTVVDSHAIDIVLNDDQVNAVRWMVSAASGLMIGTSGAEFIVRPASTSTAFSPSNKEAVRQTNRGSLIDALTVKVGHAIMFIQRGGKALRAATFDFDVDGVTAGDISILGNHLLKPKVTQLAYQQNDESVIWAYRSDGKLIGLTFEKEQKMQSYHQHTLGGVFGASGDPVVESLIAIPVGDIDQVWMIVKRTINGGTVRYIEYLEDPFDEENGDLIQDACYMDSSIAATPSGTTVSGLGHLEGQTVKVLTDGYVHPDRTVTSGAITLSLSTITVAQVGLGYTSRLKTLPIDIGVEGETSRGKSKRIFRVFVQLLSSVGLKVYTTTQTPFGDSDDTEQELVFREPAHNMDEAIPPFTGFKRVTVPGRHDIAKQLILKSDQPLPVTVLGVTMEVAIGDS